MLILDRLDRWKDQNAISAQQHALFTSLVRERPFSLFAELNVLLYAGVVAFVIGLGWTVTTFSRQFGDVLVVAVLSAIVAACLWFCFRRAPAWTPAESPPHSLLSDYTLYLCSLVWCLELTYLEQRLYLLAGHWDIYLLATAAFFFFLAYRFDNRFVLSLAFSSLAGWFGLTLARLPFHHAENPRPTALLYCLLVITAGALLRFRNIKPHFFPTYLNLVANVLFLAVLSGVFESEDRTSWFLALLLASAASLAWGITRQQFAFVAYASMYTYIGVASLYLRSNPDFTSALFFFVTTAIAMLVILVVISRRFGRTQ